MGTSERAEEFFSEYWPEARAIGDPKQMLYRAFNVAWGDVGQFFRPAVWKAYFKARYHGVGFPHGNTMRNPGAFLIHNLKILFAQQFEHFGVQVDVAAVRQAVADCA